MSTYSGTPVTNNQYQQSASPSFGYGQSSSSGVSGNLNNFGTGTSYSSQTSPSMYSGINQSVPQASGNQAMSSMMTGQGSSVGYGMSNTGNFSNQDITSGFNQMQASSIGQNQNLTSSVGYGNQNLSGSNYHTMSSY
jgi:hypothetical protein